MQANSSTNLQLEVVNLSNGHVSSWFKKAGHDDST